MLVDANAKYEKVDYFTPPTGRYLAEVTRVKVFEKGEYGPKAYVTFKLLEGRGKGLSARCSLSLDESKPNTLARVASLCVALKTPGVQESWLELEYLTGVIYLQVRTGEYKGKSFCSFEWAEEAEAQQVESLTTEDDLKNEIDEDQIPF